MQSSVLARRDHRVRGDIRPHVDTLCTAAVVGQPRHHGRTGAGGSGHGFDHGCAGDELRRLGRSTHEPCAHHPTPASRTDFSSTRLARISVFP